MECSTEEMVSMAENLLFLVEMMKLLCLKMTETLTLHRLQILQPVFLDFVVSD